MFIKIFLYLRGKLKKFTMKKILFVIMSIIFLSCSSQDDFINETDARMDAVAAEGILQNLERSLNEARPELKIKFESSKVIKVDGVYYLRAKSGEYISTTLLERDKDGYLHSKGISCTSKACGTTNGCVPDSDGKKCTSCLAGMGDCTKTVTGFSSDTDEDLDLEDEGN